MIFMKYVGYNTKLSHRPCVFLGAINEESFCQNKFPSIHGNKKSLLLALEGVGDGLSGIADGLLCGRKNALALV